jgi:hypothetical protein
MVLEMYTFGQAADACRASIVAEGNTLLQIL